MSNKLQLVFLYHEIEDNQLFPLISYLEETKISKYDNIWKNAAYTKRSHFMI